MGYVYIDEAKKRQGIGYMNPERENPGGRKTTPLNQWGRICKRRSRLVKNQTAWKEAKKKYDDLREAAVIKA